ncbi:MAG: hypothetical protein IPK58_10095 [Acidobacteria bacterium]|nr:hypothetical protein [Acidobacteriota bacterium]
MADLTGILQTRNESRIIAPTFGVGEIGEAWKNAADHRGPRHLFFPNTRTIRVDQRFDPKLSQKRAVLLYLVIQNAFVL